MKQFLWAGALAILLFSACSDDSGGGNVIEVVPTSAELSGTWGSSATELIDTCGFDEGAAFAPMFIEDNGDSVVFNFADSLGFCQQSVRDRIGDVVSLNKTDTFDGGCGLVQVNSQYVYEFDGNSFSGTATHRYVTLSGFCSNLPCDYTLAVSGSRCDDCWPGCVEPFAQTTGLTTEVPQVARERLHEPR